jgi:hypothetical protein
MAPITGATFPDRCGPKDMVETCMTPRYVCGLINQGTKAGVWVGVMLPRRWRKRDERSKACPLPGGRLS